jgi:hypothetical protein
LLRTILKIPARHSTSPISRVDLIQSLVSWSATSTPKAIRKKLNCQRLSRGLLTFRLLRLARLAVQAQAGLGQRLQPLRVYRLAAVIA